MRTISIEEGDKKKDSGCATDLGESMETLAYIQHCRDTGPGVCSSLEDPKPEAQLERVLRES